MRDDFGISFRDELVAFREELIFQLDVVLNNSIVHDHNLAGAIAVRVGVFFGRAPMRGPTRVPDAIQAVERIESDGFLQITQFSWRAPNLEFPVVAHNGDSRRIVAAIFETLQAIEDQRHNPLRSYVPDDSTH